MIENECMMHKCMKMQMIRWVNQIIGLGENLGYGKGNVETS